MQFDDRYQNLCTRIAAGSPTGDFDSIHDAYLETHASGLQYFEARAFLRAKDGHRRRIRAAERFVPCDLSRIADRKKDIAPESRVLLRDQHFWLHSALEKLSPVYREVIGLRYFEGRQPAEIAELLGIPPKTVYTRLDRAIKRLRTILRDTECNGAAA